MRVEVAVAKVAKYATSESGDTLEQIERPHGGLSLVLVDGQASGKGAKIVSNLVARKAISLLAEGIRDGAVARAAHDYLRTHRGGKVSATLNMVSLDLVTQTLVISRNNPSPVILGDVSGVRLLDDPCDPIGIYAWTKPNIVEVPLAAPTLVIVFTDGFWHVHKRDKGRTFDAVEEAREFLASSPMSVQYLVDDLLAKALARELGRPSDDLSILGLTILPETPRDEVRRLSLRFPITKRMKARRGL